MKGTIRGKKALKEVRNFAFALVYIAVIAAAIILSLPLSGCVTAHMDKREGAGKGARMPGAKNLKEESALDGREIERLLVEEELKEVDIERTVIYVDRPVYSPSNGEGAGEPRSKDAVARESQKEAVRTRIRNVNGVIYYAWDETLVYEVHTQPYRVTDVMLEPGEEVIEMPLMSESSVWEVAAGVSRRDGFDTQHFFIKPSMSALTTSLIIITDRRIYHLLLKSYKVGEKEPERYMAMVRWEYPAAVPFNIKGVRSGYIRNGSGINALTHDGALIDPRYVSFDYKMSYSVFKKPRWLPKRVYDSGRKTYIEMDADVLHTESPALFNHNNERINYRVHENLIVIDELIEKVTLRLGGEKVTIVKKKTRGKEKEDE